MILSHLRNCLLLFSLLPFCATAGEDIHPARTEVVTPIHHKTFNKHGKKRQRKQGGNPRILNHCLVFDGSMDGNRQVDPQIAVGGSYVFHGTNNGFILYDKSGKYIDGIGQYGFNGGIDPKLFFDPHNRVFGCDTWNPWDKEKKKPVNLTISETSDPRKAWNTYPIPAPDGRDGGGLGYSRKWIGYEFPSKTTPIFVLKMADAKAGKPATIYHFSRDLGHPVATQDAIDDLYFLKVTHKQFIITRVHDDGTGVPVATVVSNLPHHIKHMSYPPQSPQKGTKQKVATGDFHPKNLVLQSGSIWFASAVNIDGRSAIHWFQIKLDGTIVQSGVIKHPQHYYMHPSISVNKNKDVLIGFQECGSDMFISPRIAFRRSTDAPGSVRGVLNMGTGKAATKGTSWGDYSGSCIDGDNLTDLWTIQSIADNKGKGDTLIIKTPLMKTEE